MRRTAWTAAAVAVAAASAGVVIPALRALTAGHGGGGLATGAVVAAHVVGGAAGAAIGAPLMRRLGDVRAIAVASLLASAAVAAVLPMAPGLAWLIVGRAVEGAGHLLGVTTLIAAGASGDGPTRGRRAATLGLVLVLGIGAGIGAGGALAAHAASATMRVAAMLAAAAAGLAAVALTGVVAPPARRARARGELVAAPAWIALGERFTFGLLSVAVPFATGPRRTGALLGCFMLASVIALPLGRRAAEAWGARRLACRAATVLSAALAAAALPGMLAAPTALAWAVTGGLAAGGLYAAALALVASHAGLDERVAAMGAVHAAGNGGHALGALVAGALVTVAPPLVVIAGAGAAVVAIGVAAAARALPVTARGEAARG